MDDMVNFGFSQVAVAPSPASSGTTLTVATGEGASFPTPPFNVTIWPGNAPGIRSNSEIVRVTAIVGDVFTIVREQEQEAGQTARSILVGDRIGATITKKLIQDIIDEIASPHVEQIFIKNQTTGLYDSMILIGQGDTRQLVFT